MKLYALYYKRPDGSFEAPAAGLFESKAAARKHVYADASCPKTEFEIIEHTVQSDGGIKTGNAVS
jgi:hypothetical protein